MENITLVHNGYKVDFFHDMEDVKKEIEKRMEQYQHLNPELRIEDTGKYTNQWGEELDCELKVYFYKTLYSEMFLIIKGSI